MGVKSRKVSIILTLLITLMTSVLLITSIRRIQDIDHTIQLVQSTGHVLWERANIYSVSENDSWSYRCTESLVPFYGNASDRIRYNITKTNNSQTSWGWTAYCIWSTIEYYQSYNNTWIDAVWGGQTFFEYLIAGYNSLNTYNTPYGYFNCFIDYIDVFGDGPLPVLIANAFTAANHSIITNLYVELEWSGYINIYFSTPRSGQIAGTWTLWTNDGGVDEKYSVSFNENGVLTRYINQIKFMGIWYTVIEWKLEGYGGEQNQIPLILSMMMSGGGGIGTIEILIIIGVIGAIAALIIISGAVEVVTRKKYFSSKSNIEKSTKKISVKPKKESKKISAKPIKESEKPSELEILYFLLEYRKNLPEDLTISKLSKLLKIEEWELLKIILENNLILKFELIEKDSEYFLKGKKE